MREPAQITRHVLMVRPAAFGGNPQTAATNAFQRQAGIRADTQALALAEFDAAVDRLRAAGVGVTVVGDTPYPARPDAVFPNNWVSFHADGTMVLYPMQAPNRRAERRADLARILARDHGFCIGRIFDLSALEARGRFLEGTGSLVLDRTAGVAYAALSARTHREALAAFGRALGFEIVAFDTRGGGGQPLYHTNVMMSIGRGFAVVCAEVIEHPGERATVLARLSRTGRDLVTISQAQAEAFAGNVLELATEAGRSVLAMSQSARDALEPAQARVLGRHATLLPLAVPTIERCGGGSVRCMLAEIFLGRFP